MLQIFQFRLKSYHDFDFKRCNAFQWPNHHVSGLVGSCSFNSGLALPCNMISDLVVSSLDGLDRVMSGQLTHDLDCSGLVFVQSLRFHGRINFKQIVRAGGPFATIE